MISPKYFIALAQHETLKSWFCYLSACMHANSYGEEIFFCEYCKDFAKMLHLIVH